MMKVLPAGANPAFIRDLKTAVFRSADKYALKAA